MRDTAASRNNQLRFQPAAQIIVHLRMRTALRIIACPCGKRRRLETKLIIAILDFDLT